MSTCDSRGVCPKCGYGGASYQFDCSSGAEYVACPRCGSGYDGYCEEGGNWVVEEYSGIGVVGYWVEGGCLTWDTYANAKELEELQAKLTTADCDPAFYTFQQDGVWYVHDWVTGEEMVATEESLERIRHPAVRGVET